MAVLALVLDTAPATAQLTDDDLSTLLVEMWERTLNEQASQDSSSFVFTITFDKPVTGLGGSITMGQELSRRTIERVGDDYFCIARAFSQSKNVDCATFANVTTISYRD